MWWKKLLYGLLVAVLGFGTTYLVASITFNSLAKDLMGDYVSAKEYSKVERFFNEVTPIESEYFYSQDQGDGARVDVYPCLVEQPYYRDNGINGWSVKYDIVEEAIGFSFFNLPSSFPSSDSQGCQGRLELEIGDTSPFVLPFVSSSKEESDLNYHINFYEYVPHFASLSVYVTYDDFISHGGSPDAKISAFSIYAGDNSLYRYIELERPASFQGTMHDDYHDKCQAYREYILLYGEAHSVTTYERKDALLKQIHQVTADHPNRYFAKPTVYVVLSSMEFILAISLTISIYIAIAIPVTRAIFKKRK